MSNVRRNRNRKNYTSRAQRSARDEQTPAGPQTGTQPRGRQARELNHYLEPHFDLAFLPRTDWPDEIWDARMERLMRAVGVALKGEEATPFVEAESPETQVEGRSSQPAKAEYWQWTEFELAKLTDIWNSIPATFTPHYAHSCEVKTPEGVVYHYHRSGRLE